MTEAEINNRNILFWCNRNAEEIADLEDRIKRLREQNEKLMEGMR